MEYLLAMLFGNLVQRDVPIAIEELVLTAKNRPIMLKRF
jgi:hypothetical protein